MRSRRQSETGVTLVEVVIAAVLVSSILGAAVALLKSSSDLSDSITYERAATSRVDRALAAISEEFRKGSLATAAHSDGSTFADGDTDTAFQVRRVTGWNGSALTGDLIEYELQRDAGALDGELVCRQGTVETILARGITAFSVSRSGSSFAFSVAAGAGPTDDRRRTASGTVRVMARNP